MSESAYVAKARYSLNSFDICYIGVCVFCHDDKPTNDHHCKESDVVVTLLRNRLDDAAEAKGNPANQWCTHDNVTSRRKIYKKALNGKR
jgi:hypothetical protein